MQGNGSDGLVEKRLRLKLPGADQGDLRWPHGSLDRQQAETSNRFRVFDPFRIDNQLSQHLHTSADTGYQAVPGMLYHC